LFFDGVGKLSSRCSSGLAARQPHCAEYAIAPAGASMNIEKAALIRETFPVGPLQCNCNDE
jgi:hypothetical protein